MNTTGRDFLRTLAVLMCAEGLWQHDLKTVLAAASVWAIWPLISMDLTEAVDECWGCRKGAIVPGCPSHDPQQRLRSDETIEEAEQRIFEDWYADASIPTKVRYWTELAERRRRNAEAMQATRGTEAS